MTTTDRRDHLDDTVVAYVRRWADDYTTAREIADTILQPVRDVTASLRRLERAGHVVQTAGRAHGGATCWTVPDRTTEEG